MAVVSAGEAATPLKPDGVAQGRGWTITQRFACQVGRTPSAIAILSDGEQPLAYCDLDRRSNQVARRLLASGVGRGRVVALLSSRSSSALVTVLGILKAGAAYAPLDPAFPARLLQWIAQDCGARVTLAARRHADKLAGDALVLEDFIAASTAESDAAPETDSDPTDLAYIMYTSGSTGRPKGVAVPHRAVVRLVSDQTYARFNAEEVFLHAAPLAFDASTLEIWGALLHGGRIAIVREDQPSLQQIADVIAVQGVTTAWFTAGLFNLLVEAKLSALAGLRQILAGGDVLSPTHVQRALEALPDCQLINGYGPTENTTFTCCYRIPREGWGGGPVPIGEPIAHTYVRILGHDMSPVADGEVGALHAGGLGLATYVGAAAAGAEQKFVPDPVEPGAVLYDTGDLVRRRPDGALDFVGRRDRQAKIDGKRVEPGEIEEALRGCEGVDDALVIASRSAAGTVMLVGYLKSDAAAEGRARLLSDARAALAEKLPPHMRPSQLHVLASFPLTPNGKIDHARLPAPRQASAPLSAASDDLERSLAGIFRRTLGLEDIGVDANFFDLGATSLQLIAAHAAIEEVAGGVEVLALFEHPNLRDLARHLRDRASTSASDALRGRAQREALRRARRARTSQ